MIVEIIWTTRYDLYPCQQPQIHLLIAFDLVCLYVYYSKICRPINSPEKKERKKRQLASFQIQHCRIFLLHFGAIIIRAMVIWHMVGFVWFAVFGLLCMFQRRQGYTWFRVTVDKLICLFFSESLTFEKMAPEQGWFLSFFLLKILFYGETLQTIYC